MADLSAILSQLFDMKDPAARAAIIQGLFQTGGAVASGYGASQAAGQQLGAQQGRSKADAELALAGMDQAHDQFQQNIQQAGLAQALGSIGSPMDLARDRSSFATRREFLFGGPNDSPQYITPSASSRIGPYVPNLPSFAGAKPFFSNEAMLESESPYWEALQGISQGRVGAGDLTKAGYGANAAAATGNLAQNRQNYLDEAAQREQEWDFNSQRTREAVMKALEQEQPKSGGNWFSKLMGIGKFALPFIPGVGPVAAGLIGAGMGVAGGLAEGKGVGGALASGAISGLGSYGMDKFLGSQKWMPDFSKNPITALSPSTAFPSAMGGSWYKPTPNGFMPQTPNQSAINAEALRRGLNANFQGGR